MDFYVSKLGKPGNPGTAEMPFAGIEEARDAVRAYLEKKNVGAGAVTVHILEGEYRAYGLELGPRDSGTSSAPVLWKGEGNVVLNGGLTLSPSLFTGLEDDEIERLHGDAKEKVVRCDLSSLGITREELGELCAIGTYNTGACYDGAVISPMWCELCVNGKRQEIARYPDRDFLYTAAPVRIGTPEKSSFTDDDWAVIRNPESDIYGIDADTARRAASWKTLDGVWMFGYPMFGWADMSSPVKSIDPEKNEMETYWVSEFGMREHAPYYFYNVFEELDAPGEWFLDRERCILYLYPDCDLGTADIKLSLLTGNLVTVRDAEHITISGICFTGTRGDALDIKGNDIKVEKCVIRNIAGWAVLIDGNNCAVRDCLIERTGRGGVKVIGGDRATLTPSGNVIEFNHIHHIAEIFRTYNAAVELFGVGNVCRNNKIHDSAHLAILFHHNNHIMEYNEIYNVCKNAEDSSAIYAGRDYTTAGNIIRYNYFHDMTSDQDNTIGIYGMYCDDNMGRTTIEHNIFERCQSALLLHGGHDMIFRGNLIVHSCPKSVKSIRFVKFCYWRALLPDGPHDRRLKEVPWQSEIWQKEYPHTAEYLSWDPETVQVVPHYSIISGNVIIDHKPMEIDFDWREESLHDYIDGNTELESLPAKDLRDLCENAVPAAVPGFEPIPLEKIGMDAAR